MAVFITALYLWYGTSATKKQSRLMGTPIKSPKSRQQLSRDCAILVTKLHMPEGVAMCFFGCAQSLTQEQRS